MATTGADPAAQRQKADSLRRQGSALQASSQRALLDLYSLETRLAAARARTASLDAQVAHVRSEQALVRHQVAIAQHALHVSQVQLAAQIRALYEQGSADPLAVILGSTSLSDAISALDDLTQATKQSNTAVAVTRRTRGMLRRLSARLAAHEAQLSRLAAQAHASAAALEQAHAERAAYLAHLRTQQRLNAAAVSTLESAARAAQIRSATLSAQSATGGGIPSAPSAEPAPAATPAPSGSGTLTVLATGYTIRGRTATGLPTGPGVVAVDPSVIPLGTHLTIPGYGEGVAADTGGAVHGAVIDLWFPTLAQALAWGRRTVTITLH